MQTFGVPWDLSSAGRWMFAASLQVHRAIVAWDTATSEHRVVYAHPGANLYLANFSQDGHWALFDSEEGAGPPRMWAAPFRGLQDVPLTEWVGLGEGNYPRWSPAGGRIYFTQMHDGFECLYTRAVNPSWGRARSGLRWASMSTSCCSGNDDFTLGKLPARV
jgi:Tol biopolymer transport system component